MRALGFRKGDKSVAGEPHAHYFNPHLQYTIRPARTGTPVHDPYAPGLHHLCFQAGDPAEVDDLRARLLELGVDATEPRLYSEYHPEHYATLFDDPDGIRLEIVARTSARNAIAERWDEMTVFLNPLAAL